MSKNNLKHRRVVLAPVGEDGSAVATYSLGTGPAIVRFAAITYANQPVTTDTIIKREDASGATYLTLGDATNITLRSVSLTAGVDETGSAIAATDASAGGWPVADGLYIDIAQADGQTTGDELITLDFLYEECEYQRLTLAAQSGADASGVVTRYVRTKNKGPGVVRAIAIDYQYTGTETDIVIKADPQDFGAVTPGVPNVFGKTLFTRTSSSTDIVPSPVGDPLAMNETGAATAATDATDGGWAFKSGLWIDIAQTQAFTTGDEYTVIELWMDT